MPYQKFILSGFKQYFGFKHMPQIGYETAHFIDEGRLKKMKCIAMFY